MRAKVTRDKAGRVVLPNSLQNELHLAAGDTLDMSVEGEQVTQTLQRERGVWVLGTGDALTAQEAREALRGIRVERSRQSGGE